MITAAILISAIFGANIEESPRSSLVNSMHSYYVKQFENLAFLMDKGVGISRIPTPPTKPKSIPRFGTSRIERSDIASHTRDGGDPGYSNKEFATIVAIYGNHGKPLDMATISERYSRQSSSPGLVKQPPKGYVPPKEIDIIKKVVKKWNSGKVEPVTETHGVTYMEVRPIKLTKKECLSCHQNMKLNDPVAVMVYKLIPRINKKAN